MTKKKKKLAMVVFENLNLDFKSIDFKYLNFKSINFEGLKSLVNLVDPNIWYFKTIQIKYLNFNHLNPNHTIQTHH